ncbi:efflux RND transporter periplasmic adaptor subunit [Colwellia sp. MEBiC06753]
MFKFGISILLALTVTACSEQKIAAPQASIPEVGVITLAYDNLKRQARFPGVVNALSTINIVSEVTGIIKSINFEEGQMVEKGDVLYAIDDSTLKANVMQAQGLLEQANAALDIAEVKLKMANSLAGKEALSVIDAESIKADHAKAFANKATAVAALEAAKVLLSKATIRAPISGQVTISKPGVGETVHPDYGPLTTVVSNDNVEVYVEVDAKIHFAVKEKELAGEQALPGLINVELADGSLYDQPGRINYIGNQVSASTGTITYRVLFPNPDKRLLTGQRVIIVTTAANVEQVLSVPQSAVQEDQVGRYLLKVNDENIVEKAYAEFEQRVDDKWIIAGGVNEGDVIVVEGILKARVGSAVQPKAI